MECCAILLQRQPLVIQYINHGGGVIHYAGAKPWKEFTFGRDLWWGVYLRSIFRDNRYYYECTRTMMAGNESVKTLVKKLLKRCAAKLTGRGR